MRDYELLLVIRSNLDEAGAVEVAQNIAEQIQNGEGKVTSTNVWGRRKLAYPIDKQIEAIYILLKFKAVPTILRGLEFDLKLNESLLRYMIVKDINPDSTELQEVAAEEVAPEEAEAVDEGATGEAERAAEEDTNLETISEAEEVETKEAP